MSAAIRDYFSEKIERALSFYADRVGRINADYLAEVDKLARRTKDSVLAEFFRSTVRPDRIRAEIENAKGHLNRGEIIEADRSLETLRTNLEFVEDHLRHPHFRRGIDVRRGASEGGKRDRGVAARDRAMANRFLQLREAEQKKSKLTRRSDRQLVGLVGEENGLKLSASYEAINRGKKLPG